WLNNKAPSYVVYISFGSRIGASRRRILRHESVGGFVGHCGWSSVMEEMKYGVPIVGVSRQNDQSTNARLVEEAGVGLKVGKIERGELAKVIEEVVGGRN
ncbi:UDP-glucosyltransferase 29, partial [Linum grandiflorum]